MNELEIANALSKCGWDKRFTDWELLDLASDCILKLLAENEELSALCVEFNIPRKAQE